MGLFSKLFENRYCPYTVPGARWYKLRVKGGAVVSNESDMILHPAVVSGTIQITNRGLCILEYNILSDKNNQGGGGNSSYHRTIDYRTNGFTYLGAPNTSYVPDFTVFILAVPYPNQ